MDISMYGNHHTTHSSGFQSPELGTGGYPYFSPTHHHHHHMQNHQGVPAVYSATTNAAVGVQAAAATQNSNFYAHPHLYSPTAIEYGIHTSSNNSPSDQYYEQANDQSYYASNSSNNNNNNSGSPETHIISSDNGLSYTNLDYIAYQQAHHGTSHAYIHANDEKLHLSHHYNEEMLMNSSQASVHHHHHMTTAPNATWHHPNSSNNVVNNFMENSVNQMQAIASGGGNQQTIQQHAAMHSPNSIQSTSPTLQNQQASEGSVQQAMQQQQSQNVPTYKWMQVKRNVPKPQSEWKFFLFSIIFLVFYFLFCFTVSIACRRLEYFF